MIGRELLDHYKTNLQLHDSRHWDIEYIDNLIPFEKELYIGLLINHIRDLREKDEQARANQLG